MAVTPSENSQTDCPIDAQHFLELSRDLVVLADPAEEQLIWANEVAAEVFGRSLESLYATPILQLFHPDDLDATREAVAEMGRSGEITGFRNRCMTPDGAYRWVEWNAVQADDGRWYGTGRDVTSYIAQENELRRRSELLMLAEQAGNTGHWVADMTTGKCVWSDEVFRIHGHEPGTFQPTVESGVDAYHPDDRDHVQTCIERAIADRAPFEFELRLVQPDGTIRLVQSIGRPAVDAETGEVTRLFGVFRDITDEDRSQRYRDLEQFAYVAAHDLRQPAGTVQSFVRLLLGSLDEPTEQQTLFAHYIERATSRLSQLIADLRHYSESGARVRLSPIDLNVCLSTVLVDLQPALDEAQGSVEAHRLDSVTGNALLAAQVLQNLLTNAIRYRSPDRSLRVVIRSETRDGRVLVTVEDNGIGFDNEQAESLFEPFRRLSTRSGGSGLGLAIADRMMHQCCGSIRASGRPGEGATFTLDFPA